MMKKMKETDDAGCRSIMNEARKMARNTMEAIEKSNHEMGEQVKHDIQALEDEVEHYFKKIKKHGCTRLESSSWCTSDSTSGFCPRSESHFVY